MDDCDIVNYTVTLNAGLRFAFDSIGVIGSIFLLVIMRKTSTLKGFSGFLLFNEQITCLQEQILSIALNFVIPYRWKTVNTVILSSIQTVKNVSLLLLLAINCTLYTAICRGLAFRRIWSWRRIIGTLVLCWITSVPLGMAPLFSDGYFVFDCNAMYPFPNEDAYWRLIMYLIFCSLALVANIILLFKIVHRKVTVQPSRNLQALTDTNKKVKLAVFVFMVCILYTITYIALYTVWYSKISMSAANIDVGVLFNVVVFLNKSFMNLRIFVFLPLYKPMFLTLKSIFARRVARPINTIAIVQVPFRQRTISEEHSSTNRVAEGEETKAKHPMTYETRDACVTFGKVVSVPQSASHVDTHLDSTEPECIEEQPEHAPGTSTGSQD